jgi:hypothetical protein
MARAGLFGRLDRGLPCCRSNVPSGVTLAPEAWERGSDAEMVAGESCSYYSSVRLSGSLVDWSEVIR